MSTTHADESLLMSAEGYERRRRELDALRTDARRELAERLREARQDGDLADNPALQDLLEEREQLERRIGLLETQLAAAKIVAPTEDGSAGIGTVVRVRDGNGETFEYELVGPLEGDTGDDRVSTAAPVGRALLGQRPGARVVVTTPRGSLALEVVAVRPGATVRRAA